MGCKSRIPWTTELCLIDTNEPHRGCQFPLLRMWIAMICMLILAFVFISIDSLMISRASQAVENTSVVLLPSRA